MHYTNNMWNIVGPTGRQIFPNVIEKRASNFLVEYTPKQAGMYIVQLFILFWCLCFNLIFIVIEAHFMCVSPMVYC